MGSLYSLAVRRRPLAHFQEIWYTLPTGGGAIFFRGGKKGRSPIIKRGKGDANLFCRFLSPLTCFSSGSAARAKGEFQPQLLRHSHLPGVGATQRATVHMVWKTVGSLCLDQPRTTQSGKPAFSARSKPPTARSTNSSMNSTA